jgi:predicted XRE-type DNA-binding protein
MKMLSELMMLLNDYVREKGWTQKTAATHFGVSQPRVSDLTRGKINLFSIDSLIEMSGRAGIRIELKFESDP